MLLTEAQAAREAQVDRRTIRKLIDAGRLRASNFGTGKRRHYRIDAADLMSIRNAHDAGLRPRELKFPGLQVEV